MRLFLLPAMILAALGGMPTGTEAADWPAPENAISPPGVDAGLGLSGRPALADESGRLHLVYQNNYEGDVFELMYLQRDALGIWQTPQMISPLEISGRNGTLALDDAGNLHVLWEELNGDGGDIAYRVRRADGSWGDPTLVSPAVSFSRSPAAGVDAFGRLHLVWVDGRLGTQEILHAVKDDPDSAWSVPRVLSVGGVTPDDPALYTDGFGGLHVAWSDRGTTPATQGSYDIVYLHVRPEAPDAINPVRLVDHPGLALRPFIEGSPDGSLHLVWLDDRAPAPGDPFEIYYKRSLPGIGWGKDKRFSYDAADHGRPVIVSGENGSLHVAWEDYRGGNPEIYYREITVPFGWDRPFRISADPNSSQAPALVALPGGSLVLLWSDAQDGGVFRIFVREGTAALTSGPAKDR